MSRKHVRYAALVLTAAMATAACGSSKSTSSTTTATAPATTAGAAATTAAPAATTAAPAATTKAPATTAAAADPLGTKKAASGTPLKVGYMWSGVSPAVDNSSDLASAKAVVKWINEYGGGIAGRPLELVDCPTNSDTSVAAACGSTMTSGGFPIVLFNVVGEIEPWATPTIAAGIPILAYSSADMSILGSPDTVFTLSNPIAGIAQFPAVLAKQKSAKLSVVDVINVPAASGPAQGLAPPTFQALGAGAVDVVAISPTAADHSPDVQAELQKNPDVWHIIGNPAYCSLSIRALKDAGFKGAISGISNCIDAAALKQLGSSIEGTYISYSAGEDPKNADYQQYLAIVDKYEKSISPHGTPVGSYVVLEGFRRLMADYKGDFSPADVAKHIRGHGPLPQPTMENTNFQCNSSGVPAIKIACTGAFAYTQLDAKGAPTTFTYAK